MQSRRKGIVFLIMLLVFVPFVFAEQQSVVPATSINNSPEQYNPEQIKRQNEEYLKKLKDADPQAYSKVKSQLKYQEAMAEVMKDFAEKKISAENAKQELYPLIKQQILDNAEYIDLQINMLKKQLYYLEQIRRDPESEIKRQLDLLFATTAVKSNN